MVRNFRNWLGLGKPADVQPGESNTSTGVREEGPPSSPSGEGLATGIDANGPVVSAADAGTGGGSGGDAVGVGREAGQAQAESQAENGTINSEVRETAAASTTLLVQPGESNTSTGVREEGPPSSPSGERLGTGIDANGAAMSAADISTGGGSGGGAVGIGREAGQAEPRAENGTINSDVNGTGATSTTLLVQPGKSGAGDTSTGVGKEPPPSSVSVEKLVAGMDSNRATVSATGAGTGGGSGGDAVGVESEARQEEPRAENGMVNSESVVVSSNSPNLTEDKMDVAPPGLSGGGSGGGANSSSVAVNTPRSMDICEVAVDDANDSPMAAVAEARKVIDVSDEEDDDAGDDGSRKVVNTREVARQGPATGAAAGAAAGLIDPNVRPQGKGKGKAREANGTAGAGGGATSAGASVVGVQGGSGSNGRDGEQAIVGKGKRKAKDLPAGAPSPSSRSRHANGGGGSSASNNSTNPQEKLEEMGVVPEKAAGALSKTDGNLKAALEHLGLGDGDVEEEEVWVRPAPGQMVRRSKGVRGSSSMFDAVGYTIFGAHNMGKQLRQNVAKEVEANSAIYHDELRILGKTKEEYCEYVANPESGFEQIELSILSKMLQIQVTSVDTRTSETRNYGIEQLFKRRVFLVFDGSHYDALAKAASLTAPEKDDTRQILRWDKEKEEMAKRAATGTRRVLTEPAF